MVVFTKKPDGGLLSNKPPKDPPDAGICRHELTFSDGKVIYRSFPRPDRIAIQGYLLDDHFKGSLGGSSEFDRAWAMVQSLADAVGNGEGAGKHTNPHFSKLAELKMPLGPREAIVHLTITKEQKKGEPLAFLLRLEFNPRKLQQAGVGQLIWVFDMVSPPFDFGRFLADAKVTRFDVAVDFVGISPADLMGTAKNEGKRVEYFGADGVLEGFTLFRKRKQPSTPKKTITNPLGRVALKVYDRNRERAAHAKPPPIDGCQVTRAEVVRTGLKQPFGLTDMLTDLSFKDVELSYAAGCAPYLNPARWQMYLACRRSLGHAAAAKLLALNAKESARVTAAFSKHEGNLLQGVDLSDWQLGIQETGLDELVKLAQEAAITTSLTLGSVGAKITASAAST